MIRIKRPKTAPTFLRTNGPSARRALLAAGTGHTFEFDRSIYGHEDVRRSLQNAQHGKCCYCEVKILHVDAGDVEHFRPKAAVCQDRASHLIQPGYYWLAYVWENLLFSCSICNRQSKKNLFPLHDPSKRARSERHDLRRERPLLLDPTREDPRRFLGFLGAEVTSIRRSRKAETTIDVLRLNRNALLEDRRRHLEIVRLLEYVARSKSGAQREAQTLLSAYLKDSAEYAAMSRAATAGRKVGGAQGKIRRSTRR